MVLTRPVLCGDRRRDMLIADLSVVELHRRPGADRSEVIGRKHAGHEIVHFEPVGIVLAVKNLLRASHQLDGRELRLALCADLSHCFGIDDFHGCWPLLQLQVSLLRLGEAALALAVAPLLLLRRLSNDNAGVVQCWQLSLFHAARNGAEVANFLTGGDGAGVDAVRFKYKAGRR